MEVVVISIGSAVLFTVIAVILLSKLKNAKPQHKKEIKVWSIVSVCLAVLSIVMIFLGAHQHKKISK